MHSVKQYMIEFIQACQPRLQAGDYRLTVAETVHVDDEQTPSYDGQSTFFAVQGPRFVLDPESVHAIYPPPGHTGEFKEMVPMVVLKRRTLPWERTIDGDPPPADKAPVPWLAVLSLTPDDFSSPQQETDNLMPPVVPRTVKELLSPPEGVIGPKITLSSTESEDQPVMTIDIDADLFTRLVPTLGELPYLAHARRVSVAAKDLTGIDPEGYFSLVIGNRFPKAGVQNQNYLVSLEGFQDYLDGTSTAPKGSKMRLVCMLRWNFECTSGQTFRQLVANLDAGLLRRPLPQNVAEPEEGSPQKAALDALRMGYTALAHTTRQGEQTASFARGPLTPMHLVRDTEFPVPRSDALLRYDPAYGLFDVSYAAAWQIGRLRALQDKSFSVALFNWRRANQSRFIRILHRARHYRQFGPKLHPGISAENFVEYRWLSSDDLRRWLLELGTQLAGDDPSRIGLLGPLADPSGLDDRRESMPGIFDRQAISLIAKGDADPLELLRRTLSS